MGIRLEHAVDEEHLRVRADGLLDDVVGVELRLADRNRVRDLDALEVGRAEHAARGVLAHHLWHDDVLEFRHVRTDALGEIRLAHVIELRLQGLADLGEDGLQRDLGNEAIDQRDRQAHRRQVAPELHLDVRVLDLQRHVAPVTSPRAMHLTEARRGDRLMIDRREHLVGMPTQRLGERGRELVPGHGRGAILQRRHRIEPGLRHQVHARADDLADLDEATPHAHRRPVEPSRILLMRARPASVGRGDTQPATAHVEPEVRPPDRDQRADHQTETNDAVPENAHR